MSSYLFTSESVSRGHPDKIADYISDCILDLYLSKDKFARVAVETLVTKNTVIVAGEVRSSALLSPLEIEDVIRDSIREIGYVGIEGFDANTVTITNLLHSQSVDIAYGVDERSDKPEGAGDQGLMFGYATRETTGYMPSAIYYAHKLLIYFTDLIKNSDDSILLPDAKSQVSLLYKDNKPVSIDNIVLSHQHIDVKLDDVREYIASNIYKCLEQEGINFKDANILINPAGRFVTGGPVADTGVTGRKIVVDTYGGYIPHGGGAFSGKDPTKVDRSAAYMARYLAKNIVHSGICHQCTIQLAYAIGHSSPVSVYVNTHDGNSTLASRLMDVLNKGKICDLSPKGIRETLLLNRPIYKHTTFFGHFGRDNDLLPWESLDIAEKLLKEV